MSVTISWQVIALRLILTIVAGTLLGLDRSKHEHPAGLRTTLLVTLAASVAMIQMNLLLPTNGKPHDSYAVMDLMRLPLGILTGVGFIGAGAIVRRDNMVTGVTTAATMWFATVVGLCIGGGQIILGSVSTIIGCIVLWNFKWFESQLNRSRRASLIVAARTGAISEADLRSLLVSAGMRVASLGVVTRTDPDPVQTYECQLRWKPDEEERHSPGVVRQIENLPGLIRLEWKPSGTPKD